MFTITENLLPEAMPDSRILGVVSLNMPIRQQFSEQSNVVDHKLALATFYTDKPPSLFMTIPPDVHLESVPTLSTGLAAFHARVEALAADQGREETNDS